MILIYRKYIGYRGFARYLASEDDFFILRRFDVLHSRVLLMSQDHLSQLEEELELLDTALSDRNAPDVDNGSVRNDNNERAALLTRIYEKLDQYGKTL